MIRFFTLFFLSLCYFMANAADYYVDGTRGSDQTGNGTLALPYKTIQKAASLANPGETIFIRQGIYRESIRPARSGEAGNPITFISYQNEEVTITGLDVIANWTPEPSHASGKVWKTAMSTTLNGAAPGRTNEAGMDQIFVDGVMQAEARWPNLPAGKNPATVDRSNYATTTDAYLNGSGYANDDFVTAQYTGSGLPAVNLTDAYVHFFPGYFWWPATGKITNHAGNDFGFEYMYRDGVPYAPRPGDIYYLWGKYELLDAPGEWFRKDDGMLYLYAPQEDSPNNHVIEYKKRENSFDLRNRAYISIKNLKIIGGRFRSNAVSTNIIIDHIEATYMSHYSIVFAWWTTRSTGVTFEGADCAVTNSTIAYTVEDGIRLSGDNSKAINNVVHDAGYLGMSGTLIACTSGDNLEIKNNTVWGSGGANAIGFRFAKNSKIWYNDASASGKGTFDGGLLMGATYRNPSRPFYSENTEVAYNYVHDGKGIDDGPKGFYGTSGIYFEGDLHEYKIHHNVIWNVGGGINMPDKKYSGFRIYNNTLHNASMILYEFPDIYDMELKNNVFSRLSGNFNKNVTIANNLTTLNDYRTSPYYPNNLFATDPKYVDQAKHIFFPAAGSPLIDSGEELPPYTDGFNGTAPDIGAFESGKPPFIPGALIRPQDVRNLVVAYDGNSVFADKKFTISGLPAGRRIAADFRIRIGTAPSSSPMFSFDYLANQFTFTNVPKGSLTGIQPIFLDFGADGIFRTSSTIDLGATLTMPSVTLSNGTVGTVYAVHTLPLASGGTAPYVYAATGIPAGMNFNPANRTLTGTPLTGGNYSIVYTVTDGIGSVLTATYSLNVNVDAPIAAGATACSGSNVTLQVTNLIAGVSYNWYGPTGNTPLSGGNSGTFVTPLINANTTFYVESVSGTAISSRTSVAVNIGQQAVATDVVASNASLCSGATTTLTASSSTVTTPIFTWYNDAALGSVAFTGASFSTGNITANRNYYVTVKGANKCENLPGTAKLIMVNVNQAAVAADVTANNATVCTGSSVTLTASSSTVTTPIFTWYNDAALRSVAFTGASFSIGNITANRNYYVTVKGGNKCENLPGTAKLVTVNVNQAAVAADVTANNTTVCAGSPVTLTASSSTVTTPIFTWYNDAALSSVAFTGASFSTGSLTGNRNYYVTVKGDNKCENLPGTAKLVTVNVNQPAVAADVTANNATVCTGSSVTLSASSSTVTSPIFTWYNDAALSSVAFTGASFSTGSVTANRNYYVTVKGDNKCENPPGTAKLVTVSLRTAATYADILSSNATICAGSSATLIASSTTVTNPIFTWYNDAALSSVAFVGPRFTSNNINNNKTYYLTVSGANKCENLPGTAKLATIYVTAPAVAADINANNATICAGSTATLSASSTSVSNPVFTWYNDAALRSVAFTGPNFTVPNVTAGRDYYLTVQGSNRCENLSGMAKTVSIVVNRPALAADITAANVAICSGTSATLHAFRSTVTNPIFSWYNDAGLSSLAFTGASITLANVTNNSNLYLTVKGTNKCENAPGTALAVSITVNATPARPIIANSTACAGAVSTLLVQNVQPDLIYQWYTDAIGGMLLHTGSAYTTAILSASSDYYVQALNSNGCMNVGGRTRVSVTILPVLSLPVLTIQSTTTNQITFGWSVVTGAQGYEISLNSGITWLPVTGGAAASSYVVNGLRPGSAITARVRATGLQVCQASPASLPITGTASNPFADTLYVPNTFTPNGDGRNDTFTAYGNLVGKFRMRTFNQRGQLLHETTSITNGWDGTFKGKMQPNGVYVYFMEASFDGGREKLFKGTITLLR